MKISTLLLCIAISSTIYSQTINNFNSATGSIFAVATATLDQSANGAGTIWNFTNLVATADTTTDTYAAPTVDQTNTYPGTTNVQSITTSPSNDVNLVFTKDTENEISITGSTGTDFDLNFDVDNALIGTFPLAYGYDNTDNVAGTFAALGQPGDFTGTIRAEVDGYGTLTLNDIGGASFSGNVTRLKTFLDVSFTVLLSPGTASQLAYNYYDDNGDLVFRTMDVAYAVPALNQSGSSSTIESLYSSPLAVSKNKVALSRIQIAPNPVGEQLHIRLLNYEIIKAVVITDITGRTIIKENNVKPSILVSHLKTGIYFATISTNQGSTTKQFIKK